MDLVTMEDMDLRDRHSTSLYCSNCRQMVRVSINRHATGNLTIKCPKCGHEHYRYCENGEITEDRWRSSAQTMHHCYYSTSATSDTATYPSATSTFLRNSWQNTDSTANW